MLLQRFPIQHPRTLKRNNAKRRHSIESKMIAIKDKYGMKDKGVANPIQMKVNP